ncbi:DUF6415 family natural product biosynthesis protein [Streptomyces virginiae]|uniref:DUF6415 family natural product biosynthesis protein n=1 Tax=Streptomyces virginiae TaxID=1961 RepID=UPI0036ABDD01
MSWIALFRRTKQRARPQLSGIVTVRRTRVFDASEATLMRVLDALRPVQHPTVVDSIFDTLDVILGPDYIPDKNETTDLSLRMRGYLKRLLAVVPEDDAFTDLVKTARALLDVEAPGDHLAVRLHLRRMALTALYLRDHLAPLPVPSP